MSAEARRRPLHAEQAGGGEGEEKDPMVMDESKADDDQWDLDDESWTEEKVQARKEDSELSRRRRILRRGTREVSIAFVCHLVLMCFYVYVHVYDATIFKRNKGKGFDGAFTFGGRWKFLTYINLWLQFIYFFLCFFTDIMPWSAAKLWFQKCCDFVFTTIALPMAIFVTAMFWALYVLDREMVYPKDLDEFIPVTLNHYWHSAVLVGVLVELVLVFHRFPSNMVGMLTTFAYSTAYIIWIVFVYSAARIWPYPFLNAMPVPAFPLFFTGCFLFGLLLYFIGKTLGYLIWRERQLLMDELGL